MPKTVKKHAILLNKLFFLWRDFQMWYTKLKVLKNKYQNTITIFTEGNQKKSYSGMNP